MTSAAEQDTSDVPASVTRSGAPTAALRQLLRSAPVRFLLVGGGSAAVDTGLLWLLHGAFGVWLPLATFIGVATSNVVNFLLNRNWVFTSGGAAGGQAVRYLLLVGFNWLVTVLAVAGLAGLGLNYLVARIGVLVVLTVFNFLAYRFWVFRAVTPDRLEEPDRPVSPDRPDASAADVEGGGDVGDQVGGVLDAAGEPHEAR